MPIPVNYPGIPTAANAGELVLDQRVVAASAANFLATADDFASDFASDFVAPINGQRTRSVLVPLGITVETAETPVDRNGLLPRTGVNSGSVEVALTGDRYAKVGVDTLGIDPAQHSQRLGVAVGQAVVRVSNADVLRALTTGTVADFDGAATDGQAVWTSLLGAVVSLTESDYATDDLVAYIAPGAYGSLLGNVSVLSSGGNPQGTAAQLLGIRRVRTVNFTGADAPLAVIANRGAVAAARVLSGVQRTREDWDELVEARILFGTALLDAGAVRVIRAPAAG